MSINSVNGIDDYLTELEQESLAPWEQDAQAEQTEDWFEKAAADFLAKPEVDAELEAILELVREFTRRNFSLRAGLLYRQQLQNTPSYETVMELEAELIELAGEANRVHEAQANPELFQDRKQSIEAAYNQKLIAWAAETLMPRLEGSRVVKVTRSTKKPKNILKTAPASLLVQVGTKYKALLEANIAPQGIEHALANSQPAERLREWLGESTGREPAPAHVLLGLLWSRKERNQWLYGLVEYATALVNLVAQASEIAPGIKPRKYLCYFQKKSEATLYRGQEELEAMVANMRADKLLPDLESEVAEWERGATQPSITPDELDPPAVAPAKQSAEERPLTLAERLRAKRLGQG